MHQFNEGTYQRMPNQKSGEMTEVNMDEGDTKKYIDARGLN